MSGRHPTASDRPDGLMTMLRVTGRIQLRSALIWVLVLGGSMIGTAASVAALYDTPAKIHTYAQAVTSGNALVAINGKVEGIDSLGGVIQDEFGFMAAFLLPLLGIALVARATRREEESGRLELLLGGRIARHAPTSAALLVATATIAATGALFTLGLALSGVPLEGSVLYALSLCTLAFVFAGLAALLAQLTLHARGVYSWSLMVLAASYVVRGVGDATTTWVTWLSPLGWAEKAAPFGEQRWWVLAVPIAVGLSLAASALWLAARRDLGSALIRSGAGPERAEARLRTPIGLAVWIHRPAILGWLAGGVILTGMMGALSQQLLDAIAGNPAIARAMGIAHPRALDGVVAATQLYVAVLSAGYVVQAVGNLRVEESEGRLETRLSGSLSRAHWLASHTVVVLGGLLTIVVGSSLVLGLATAAVSRRPGRTRPDPELRTGLSSGRARAGRAGTGVLRPASPTVRGRLGRVFRDDVHRVPRSRVEAPPMVARLLANHPCGQPPCGRDPDQRTHRDGRHRRGPHGGRLRSLPQARGTPKLASRTEEADVADDIGRWIPTPATHAGDVTNAWAETRRPLRHCPRQGFRTSGHGLWFGWPRGQGAGSCSAEAATHRPRFSRPFSSSWLVRKCGSVSRGPRPTGRGVRRAGRGGFGGSRRHRLQAVQGVLVVEPADHVDAVGREHGDGAAVAGIEGPNRVGHVGVLTYR